MSANDKAYLTGAVTPTLLRKTLPIMGGYFCALTFNLVDTYFVSLLGKAQLAVMGYAEPVSMLMFSFAVGIGAGTSSAVSRALGDDDRPAAARLCRDSLALASLAGLVFMTAGLTLLDPMFALLGATRSVMPYAWDYMTPWLLSAPLMIVVMVGNSSLQSSGATGLSGALFAGGAVLNGLLDPLLIFGWGPVPALGIAGAAWATFLSRLAMVAVTLVYLAGPLELLKLTLPRDGELLESWKEILYVGIPAASTSLLFPIAIGVVTRLVSRYGEAAVGALGAGQRVDSIVMVAYWAMSRVEAPMAGQNYGAGRMRRVHEAQRSGTVLALAWGGLCLIVLWAGADLFAHVLVGEPGVWDPLVLYLRISAVGLGFRGLTVLGGAFFSALKHPLPAATIDIVRMFLLTLPLAWVGDRLGGVAGIFAGVAAANVLAGMLAAGATERFSRRLLGRKIITEVMSVEDS